MTPPRLPQRLIAWLVDSRLADAITGDLAEVFLEESRRAPLRAWFSYWRRAVGAIWHLHRVQRTSPRGDASMTTMLSDLVRGLRLFVTQPAYAWAAVVTLALAIGANTVIFSIANILVLKPLPLGDAERLGWIQGTTPNSPEGRSGVSLPEYAVYRDEVSALADLAAYRRQPVALREHDQSERVLSQQVIGGLQTLWGLAASRGRTLTVEDERPGAPMVTVLSHRFWAGRFGGAEVVGRTVYIDGRAHTIVGVLTPDIELGTQAEIDVWLPWTSDPTLASRAERGWRAVGRLEGGATLADADAQVTAITARLQREQPDTNLTFTAHVVSTKYAIAGTNTWLILSLLSLVVAMLLLLACANVMNLLISRLIGRRQELAVRTALGATRARVVRQIVSESVTLGLAGGVLGLGIAWIGLEGIHAVAAEPIFQQLAIDVRVLAFAVLLSFVAPLAFSVVPTLRILREDVRVGLGEGSLRSIGSAAAARSRSGLVVLQVTLAVTLLAVASLVVQSMRAIAHADPGFDPSRLLVAQIDVAPWKVPSDADALQLRQRLLARVAAIPGATAVALATELPAMHLAPEVRLAIANRPAATERDEPRAYMTVVSADYFTVIDVPILAGRAFQSADAASRQAVVVVSHETARRFWGGPADAVGSAIRIADPSGPTFDALVIGVSRAIQDPDLAEVPRPALYVLDEHRPMRRTHILVRASMPGSLAGSLRAAVADIDADLPTYQLRTLAAAQADENSSNVLLTGMFVAFAAVAMLLATAGLYGVMSYAVTQRSGEIAVRLALGAPAGVIARQVIGHSARLTALGTVLGLACAYGLARLVASILYGVSAADPPTYVATVALTLSAALAATWLPMRRAAAIDPIESLRRG